MNELLQYFESDDPIPWETVERALESNRIGDMAAARHALINCADRIYPVPSSDVCGRYLVTYYLKCMRDAPEPEGLVHSRFGAANELRRLLEHWEPRPHCKQLVDYLVRQVSATFRTGDSALRNAIETGFLEHVFERGDLVCHFQHWSDDPEMSDVFKNALRWGDAHRRTGDSA